MVFVTCSFLGKEKIDSITQFKYWLKETEED